MSNRWVAVLVAVVFFVAAVLILYQQKVSFGVWFQVSDLHHETLAIASAALALGILIGTALTTASSTQPAQAT